MKSFGYFWPKISPVLKLTFYFFPLNRTYPNDKTLLDNIYIDFTAVQPDRMPSQTLFIDFITF